MDHEVALNPCGKTGPPVSRGAFIKVLLAG